MDTFDIKRLEKEQRELAKRIILKDGFDDLELVVGADLTFLNIRENPTRGLAALVVVNVKNGKVLEKTVVEGVVDFPYIPTFLAYRELPLLLKGYEKLKTKANLYLIDGHGIAHPRRMGIASHFGVILDVPSIGVAKSPLFGRYDEPKPQGYNPLYSKHSNEIIGWVIKPKGGKKLLFVSPGHKVSLDTSLRVVLSFLKNGWDIPTFLAHKILQEERKKRVKSS